MTCLSIREKVHDFLDYRLSELEEADFRRHLGQCAQCRLFCEDFRWIQEALRLDSSLKPIAEEQLWQRIQARVPRGISARLGELWEDIPVYWRDLDGWVSRSRIIALPITLSILLLMLLHFSPLTIQEMPYPVLNLLGSPSSGFEQLVITPTPVRQQEGPLNGLMNTAWKIPYEDSLSLVVEITPEGYAQIDDILKYPKNQDLLEAVDLTLRRTRFETTSHLPKPFVIYSFQKIDVYGDQNGM